MPLTATIDGYLAFGGALIGALLAYSAAERSRIANAKLAYNLDQIGMLNNSLIELNELINQELHELQQEGLQFLRSLNLSPSQNQPLVNGGAMPLLDESDFTEFYTKRGVLEKKAASLFYQINTAFTDKREKVIKAERSLAKAFSALDIPLRYAYISFDEVFRAEIKSGNPAVMPNAQKHATDTLFNDYKQSTQNAIKESRDACEPLYQQLKARIDELRKEIAGSPKSHRKDRCRQPRGLPRSRSAPLRKR